MDTLNLAENLIRLRREKEVTQEEVASFIGVTKASVSQVGDEAKPSGHSAAAGACVLLRRDGRRTAGL